MKMIWFNNNFDIKKENLIFKSKFWNFLIGWLWKLIKWEKKNEKLKKNFLYFFEKPNNQNKIKNLENEILIFFISNLNSEIF